MGLLIGGVVGVGALAVLLATRKGKEPLDRMGEMIVRIGEILEEQPCVNKKIHSHGDAIEDVVGLLATGISLWKKFKK
jgi:gas vesicle protein